MNSMHDAVQSRNGPVKRQRTGKEMPTATSGWPCYAATAAGRLRPGLSPTAALASPKFVALSVGSYIYLFITENNLT